MPKRHQEHLAVGDRVTHREWSCTGRVTRIDGEQITVMVDWKELIQHRKQWVFDPTLREFRARCREVRRREYERMRDLE